MALVLSATLLTRSALQMARPDPRFPLEDKLVVQIDPESAGYDQVRSIQACEALADHLASLPDVRGAGDVDPTSSSGAAGGCRLANTCRGTERAGRGRPLAREAALVDVGRDYFAAMEIPLLQGRLFDRLDSVPDAEKVTIIDESLARRLRPDGNALGCLIQWGCLTASIPIPTGWSGSSPTCRAYEDREVRAQMYIPAEPDELSPYLYLHVADRGSARPLRRGSPRRFAGSIRVCRSCRWRLWPRDAMTIPRVWLARFGARLALAAGAAALFLAALGIYAIKGYMVASRTSEIGIRMALGATHGNIMGMVLREGLVLTMVGLMVGLLLGLGVAQVAASLLYGVSPVDPVSIVVTVALLGAASLLASYIPARRAAKVDPMVALRCE